jgi:hypothetical protein
MILRSKRLDYTSGSKSRYKPIILGEFWRNAQELDLYTPLAA